eukprot:scaffold111919_cov32-Prasinocladus_malaysianus.AAC.1
MSRLSRALHQATARHLGKVSGMRGALCFVFTLAVVAQCGGKDISFGNGPNSGSTVDHGRLSSSQKANTDKQGQIRRRDDRKMRRELLQMIGAVRHSTAYDVKDSRQT